MTGIQAVLIGILEGLTEFLPVSSTAHLVLGQYVLGIDITSDAAKVFEIAIQLGAVAAIPLYYRKQLFKKETIRLLLYAFIPTAVLGLILKEFSFLLLESLFVIAWALILGGIILVAVEWYIKKYSHKKAQPITPVIASVIGAAQGLALIPGVSRSGATIVAGLLMGIPRAQIAEFSFLLSVPTLGAATALALLKTDVAFLTPLFMPTLMIGMFSALITAWIVIHVFMKLIRKYTFVPFGVYRIILGLSILFFLV